MKHVIFFSKTILKGISQIMLQDNAVTGFLFLIGIFYGSVHIGLATLLATAVGTASAYLLHFEKNKIEQGLYGFNPALVGAATLLLLKPLPYSWAIVVIGSIVSVYIQHFFITRKIAAFTLPFVLVTWLIFYSVKYLFVYLVVKPSMPVATEVDQYLFAIKGYGQVIFQSNIISGILFFAGVFINTPLSALYGLAGAVLSGILGYSFASNQAFANGLLSYNGVLCAIVFAGKKKEDGYRAFAAVLLSLVFTILMMEFHILVLTFPFVLASGLVLYVRDQQTNTLA